MLTRSIGIDSRGKLFRMDDKQQRHYADMDDPNLVELQSILSEQKQCGGRFYLRENGEISTTWGARDKANAQVVGNLWFDVDEAKWNPPLSLSTPWTDKDTESFVARLTR